ncbi:hypothetical protein RND81_02G144300 [Saponaria officinalis]|uniref:Epidermal patterning factor-like protein n=1 Tax=Saponaria officinalis TaxID=3572 RepID=A0AAW1MQ39_SAPOF
MVSLNIITSIIFGLSLFSPHLFPTIQGRVLLNITNVNPTTNKSPKITKEEKTMIKGQVMGSRPPKCQGRCGSCGGHCVAVQVPSSVPNIEYARGELSSDYKPITWKCQCGPFLFNP